MCGRITLYTRPERLSLVFDAEPAPDADLSGCLGYNIPPTRSVLGVTAVGDGRRVLDRFRWGLIPGWTKDGPVPNGLFNARGETMATKPSFGAAFVWRRLIIPADGFYEWGSGPGGQRQPHYFRRADDQPLALAGLWESWRGPDGATVRSCTIVTTGANGDMAGIHDRMPVILEPDAVGVWLDTARDDRDEVEWLVHSGVEGTLVHHPVSTRVGNVRNDDPQLIERFDPETPGTLFD